MILSSFNGFTTRFDENLSMWIIRLIRTENDYNLLKAYENKHNSLKCLYTHFSILVCPGDEIFEFEELVLQSTQLLYKYTLIYKWYKYIMSETPREYDISKIDFKTLINKSVNTSDGILLGKIDSISNNHFIIRKNITDEIRYYIPFDEVNRVDDDVLWLGITNKDASQHILSIKDDNDKDNSKVEYETVTFRLNENVIDSIRSEAENRTTSINNFVNYVLKRFTDSDRFEPETGMIHINSPVVIEIFNKKSNEEIVNLAKFTAKDAICNTILFTHGKKDLDTFLLWIENDMNNHSFTVRHITEGNTHKYIIRHEMGYKFSLFYKTIIEEIFYDNLKEKNIEFTLSDEILLFVFEK